MSTTIGTTANAFEPHAIPVTAFTAIAATVTVMGFVFIPPAGALLALGALWFGAQSVWSRNQSRETQGFATLSMAGFATLAAILGFVFIPPAGALIAGLALWIALGKPLPGSAAETASTGLVKTGNEAFDAYRAETLRRLDDERDAFDAFVTRLRQARDKHEFDQFMADRTWAAQTTPRDA